VLVRTLYTLGWALEFIGVLLAADALRRRSRVLDELRSAADDMARYRHVMSEGRPASDPDVVELAERSNSVMTRLLAAREKDRPNERRNRVFDWAALVLIVAGGTFGLVASLVWYSQP
jgi:hypothetical protein